MSREDDFEVNPCEKTFNGLMFKNFPSRKYPDGETTYLVMDAVVADRFAEQIPAEMKPAITVDWKKLDVETLMEEAEGELGIKDLELPFKNEEEADAVEQDLLAKLNEAGIFG